MDPIKAIVCVCVVVIVWNIHLILIYFHLHTHDIGIPTNKKISHSKNIKVPKLLAHTFSLKQFVQSLHSFFPILIPLFFHLLSLSLYINSIMFFFSFAFYFGWFHYKTQNRNSNKNDAKPSAFSQKLVLSMAHHSLYNTHTYTHIYMLKMKPYNKTWIEMVVNWCFPR